MKNMIKVKEIKDKYGEYLVDEKKLKELLVKPKPETVWDLKYGDKYYCLDNAGNINYITWHEDAYNLFQREIGNVFLTHEETMFELERKKCESIMLKYGRRTFKPGKNNYYIDFVHYHGNVIYISHNCKTHSQGSIYFDNKELAWKAIHELGTERLKKYVFRVSE